MKKIKLILVAFTLVFSTMNIAKAQVNVNVNIGPAWGPAGYSGVRYYYIPDVEAYYDVPSAMFIYYSGGVWVHRAYLPVRYRSYDLYNGYKVVMTDYRGNKPYIYHKSYKVKYAKGYRGKPQKTIGMKSGNKNSQKKSSYKAQPGKKSNVQNGGKSGGGKQKSGSHGGGKGKK